MEIEGSLMSLRTIPLPAAMAGLLLLGGCSSVYDLFGGTDRGPQVFGGVRTWPEGVSETLGVPMHGCAAMEYLVLYGFEGLIDLPCSLVGDLLCLPVTIPFEIFRR
jgi:uncharacterized protein YceK